MDQAIEWKHSTKIEDISISYEVKPAVQALLEKLEKSYGTVFVKKVLQYMTLSRHGFYENYFQDILAKDENNATNISYSINSCIKRIFMYRWYHRMFWEVAQDKYCQDIESNQNCHKIIVKTFQHEKFNKLNPFWMKELPYHATCSNNINDLKNNFLLDLKFMQIKIETTDVDQLINDYEYAVTIHNQDQTLKLVHQTLLIAAYKIRLCPAELPGQLFGRLYGYKTDSDLEHLLEQCLSPPQESIISNKNFMAGPNNLLSKSIIAHKTEIKSTLISNDNCYIISCSSDNCIKVFYANNFMEKITI
ncbi:unnamed protein product, partial [Didymodactylos carnosus]